MNVRLACVSVFFLFLFCFACKKSDTTTSTVSYPTSGTIDSMKGYYAGITSGDSVYFYTDVAGKVHSGVHSFSLLDSLVITAADSTSITVSSRLYNVTFAYYYYLTGFDSVSYLQVDSVGQGGYIPLNAYFVDTANGINHVGINISYGASKNITSNFVLYKRQ